MPKVRVVGFFNFMARKGSGQLQTKNIIGVVASKLCFVFTLFCEIHIIHCRESCVEEFGILFRYQFCLENICFLGAVVYDLQK